MDEFSGNRTSSSGKLKFWKIFGWVFQDLPGRHSAILSAILKSALFMKWLFFDKCEKVKLLPHQRNIYFYRLKFPIRKFDNDLGYFRKNFEAVHQAIRGSRTSLDMVYPDLYFWWRVLSRGWLMIKKVNRIERNFCNYSWTCSVDAPQNVVILE